MFLCSVFPEAVTGKEGKDEKDSDQYLESDDSQGSTVRRSRDSLNLKRTVGLFSGISLIVGTMIGKTMAKHGIRYIIIVYYSV